jgi:hypothetical protein
VTRIGIEQRRDVPFGLVHGQAVGVDQPRHRPTYILGFPVDFPEAAGGGVEHPQPVGVAENQMVPQDDGGQRQHGLPPSVHATLLNRLS